MIIAPGSTSVSVDVFFADDAGAALTGKVAADFPACKWSSGSNTADTTITLSDLAAITTAHPNDNTAGGIKEREGGWYRLDLPNNMLTSAGRKILTFAETTNKRIIAPFLDVQLVQINVIQAAGTAWGSGAITAASIAADAITAAKIADGAIDAATFAASAITATVIASDAITAAKIADGAIDAATFATGAITATAIASDAITAAKVADGTIDAATFATGAITAASLAADAGGEIADAVWDEALSGHSTAGSAGKALTDAGSAGDPWATALPGAYVGGTAGFILGTNLNGTITSRASQTSLDTVDDFLDTEIAAIIGMVDDIGVAGAGLTALGDTRLANLNATVSSRMATYTQPTGFLAATFPTTVASTTNITAGTITTVTTTTNLTNAATAGDFTATMKTSLSAATPAVTVSDKTGFILAATGLDSIPMTAPSGLASTFREAVIQTWRRFFKKTTLTSTELKTYADNGSTVITTQQVSDDTFTQTQGAAS